MESLKWRGQRAFKITHSSVEHDDKGENYNICIYYVQVEILYKLQFVQDWLYKL